VGEGGRRVRWVEGREGGKGRRGERRRGEEVEGEGSKRMEMGEGE